MRNLEREMELALTICEQVSFVIEPCSHVAWSVVSLIALFQHPRHWGRGREAVPIGSASISITTTNDDGSHARTTDGNSGNNRTHTARDR